MTTEKVPTEPTASRQVRAARSLEVRGTVARAAPSARAGGEARPLVRQAAVYHGAAMVLEHHGLLSLEMIVPIKLHPRAAEPVPGIR